ncbi:hypothetical protein FKW77_003770 [Venturia effusa]|uniref:Uncharacterized protein n=1 Tax=Venturia effusa TaxID=50376 RepID=A0A517KZ95_9PEZI|nr:hypothetical protein FKW77_003770 [Venturia effusa]
MASHFNPNPYIQVRLEQHSKARAEIIDAINDAAKKNAANHAEFTKHNAKYQTLLHVGNQFRLDKKAELRRLMQDWEQELKTLQGAMNPGTSSNPIDLTDSTPDVKLETAEEHGHGQHVVDSETVPQAPEPSQEQHEPADPMQTEHAASTSASFQPGTARTLLRSSMRSNRNGPAKARSQARNSRTWTCLDCDTVVPSSNASKRKKHKKNCPAFPDIVPNDLDLN